MNTPAQGENKTKTFLKKGIKTRKIQNYIYRSDDGLCRKLKIKKKSIINNRIWQGVEQKMNIKNVLHFHNTAIIRKCNFQCTIYNSNIKIIWNKPYQIWVGHLLKKF